MALKPDVLQKVPSIFVGMQSLDTENLSQLWVNQDSVYATMHDVYVQNYYYTNSFSPKNSLDTTFYGAELW